MKVITVLGAGIMGAGIAQVAAQGGYNVILRDLQMTLVNDAINTINNNLDSLLEVNKIGADEKREILSRIQGTTDLSFLKEADLVIEAVVENMAIKKQIFSELDNLCKDSVILATNTSSLSITEIASVCKNPAKVIGIHFFNPVPQINIVEIVKGIQTSSKTISYTQEFLTKIGKEFIIIDKERPGYVVNRILTLYINEAIFLYADGLAKANDIDEAMQLGAGMPIGPLALADKIGLDTLYATLLALFGEYRDNKYRPHPHLATMIRAGYLGEKSGQGFYKY